MSLPREDAQQNENMSLSGRNSLVKAPQEDGDDNVILNVKPENNQPAEPQGDDAASQGSVHSGGSVSRDSNNGSNASVPPQQVAEEDDPNPNQGVGNDSQSDGGSSHSIDVDPPAANAPEAAASDPAKGKTGGFEWNGTSLLVGTVTILLFALLGWHLCCRQQQEKPGPLTEVITCTVSFGKVDTEELKTEVSGHLQSKYPGSESDGGLTLELTDIQADAAESKFDLSIKLQSDHAQSAEARRYLQNEFKGYVAGIVTRRANAAKEADEKAADEDAEPEPVYAGFVLKASDKLNLELKASAPNDFDINAKYCLLLNGKVRKIHIEKLPFEKKGNILAQPENCKADLIQGQTYRVYRRAI